MPGGRLRKAASHGPRPGLIASVVTGRQSSPARSSRALSPPRLWRDGPVDRATGLQRHRLLSEWRGQVDLVFDLIGGDIGLSMRPSPRSTRPSAARERRSSASGRDNDRDAILRTHRNDAHCLLEFIATVCERDRPRSRPH
jgi:hypothetical protein